ncbi:uncharacterized protein BJ171DRAFT_445672 [Polychytrium aggregatum]|uniref:uncharacterized protein n=1 Tax=Polychytrium aggregatum TaxID=110093 RepID=UPI0022FE3DEF|nr:uncharacterized protein BJ171DRAFT_445672 [Polychytrium aggregatum]KAI9199230.1 hypothetical protein BJ171DRAFT_445672 [Polychytrium aggregatum]
MLSTKQYTAGYLASVSSPEQRKLFEKSVLDKENQHRQIFAQNPTSAEVKDPLVSLLPVHQTDPAIWKFTPANDSVPKIMPRSEDIPVESASIGSAKDFRENWKAFSEVMLETIDWNNVMAAGGSVLACLEPLPAEHAGSGAQRRKYMRSKFPSSDLDLFIYGLDEDQAKQKMMAIYNALLDVIPFEVTVFRSPHAVTLVSQYPYRHIQIVLRLYRSPAEILMGFDVDCCGVGFDGQNVYATRRAHLAISSKVNCVDMSRRSTSYEVRLAKYAERGYEIAVPQLQRDRIDPQVYERSFEKVQGLARLLLFESLSSQGARMTFKEQQRTRRLRPSHDKAGAHRRLAYRRNQDLTAGGVDSNDYSTLFMPYGPGWTAEKIRKKAYKKDYILNNPYLMHKFRRTRHHQHPCFFGTMEDVMEDCCGQCPPLPDDYDPEEKNIFVFGPLGFIKDDPGRQQIGSFHPVDDNEWTKDAYLPDGIYDWLQYIADDNVQALKQHTAAEEFDFDQRDWLGRTLLQVAVLCNSIKVATYLIDKGASISLTLPDGRNPLHIASEYGYVEILDKIVERNRANISKKAQDEEKRHDSPDQPAKKKLKLSEEDEGEIDSVTQDDLSEEEDYVSVDPAEATKPSKAQGGEAKGDEEEEIKYDIIDTAFVDWDMKMTPLHYACLHGQREAFERLVEAGCSISQNVEIKVNDWSPKRIYTLFDLALACIDREKQIGMIEALIAHKVPLDRLNTSRTDTIWHRAVTEERMDIIQILSSSNHIDREGLVESMNLMNASKTTPVALAAQLGRPTILKALLDAGCSADIPVESCSKFLSASSGDWWSVRDYQNDPNVMKSMIAQPLKLAIDRGHHECARLLIEHGADVNFVTSSPSEETALDAADRAIGSATKAVAIMREKQSNPEAVADDPLKSLRDRLKRAAPNSVEEFLLDKLIKAQETTITTDVKPTEDPSLPRDDWVQALEDDHDDAPAVVEGCATPEERKLFQVLVAERTLRRLKLCRDALISKGASTAADLKAQHLDAETLKQQKELQALVQLQNQTIADAQLKLLKLNQQNATVLPSLAPAPNPLHQFQIMDRSPGAYSSVTYTNIESKLSTAYLSLFRASWKGDVTQIRKLTVDAPDKKQLLVYVVHIGLSVTPLMLATWRGHSEAVAELLRIARLQRSKKDASESDKPTRAVINNYEDEDMDEESNPSEPDVDAGGSDPNDDDNDDDEDYVEDGEAPSVRTVTATTKATLLDLCQVKSRFFLEYAPHDGVLSRKIDATALDIALGTRATEAARAILEALKGEKGWDLTFKNDGKNYGSWAVGQIGVTILKGDVKGLRALIEHDLAGLELFDVFPDIPRPKEHEAPSEAKIEEAAGKKSRVRPYTGLNPKSMQLPAKPEAKPLTNSPVQSGLMHLAAAFGRADLMQRLLDLEWVTEAVTVFMSNYSSSPRAIALSRLPKAELTKILTVYFQGLSTNDMGNPSPIHWAVHHNRPESIAKLASIMPAAALRSMLFEKTRNNQLLPTHSAASCGNFRCFNAIVEAAKTVGEGDNIVTHTDGLRKWNVLHHAAYEGRVEFIEHLFKFVPANQIASLLQLQSDTYCYTPTMLAAVNGHRRTVKLLLDAQQNLAKSGRPLPDDAKSYLGCSPLHLAIRGGYLDIVKSFLSDIETRGVPSTMMAADARLAALGAEDAGGMHAVQTSHQIIHRSFIQSSLKSADLPPAPKAIVVGGKHKVPKPKGDHTPSDHIGVYRYLHGQPEEPRRSLTPLEATLKATQVGIRTASGQPRSKPPPDLDNSSWSEVFSAGSGGYYVQSGDPPGLRWLQLVDSGAVCSATCGDSEDDASDGDDDSDS